MRKSMINHIIKNLKQDGFYEFGKEYIRAYPDNLKLSTKGIFNIDLNTEFWRKGIHSDNELFTEITIQAVEEAVTLDCFNYYNIAYVQLPKEVDCGDEKVLEFFWENHIVIKNMRMTKKLVLKRLGSFLNTFEDEEVLLDYLFKLKGFISPSSTGYYNAMYDELRHDLEDGITLEEFVGILNC